MAVFDDLQKLTGNPYHRAEYSTDLLDNYVLRKARKDGIRLPSAGSLDEWVYFGAWVAQSHSGLNKNITYADLSSLYPNLLRALNVGPSTIVGLQSDLDESEWTEDDCVWGYVDSRPVKHLDDHESYRDYTNGKYKIVYDDDNSSIKWTGDPQYERCYYLKPSIRTSFLRELVQKLIDLKDRYRGTSLYAPLKGHIVNCFTEDTKVMTPSGEVGIRDLDVGDEVYSYNKDDDTVEVKPVTETYSYPDYDGDLVEMSNYNIDFTVTPNHRMLVENKKSNGDDLEYIEAGDFAKSGYYQFTHDWDMEHGESFDVFDLTEHLDASEYEVYAEHDVHGRTFCDNLKCDPERVPRGTYPGKTYGYKFTGSEYEEYRDTIEEMSCDIRVRCGKGQKWVPAKYDGDDALDLMAWFITEGSTYTSTKKEYETTTRGVTNKFDIAQERENGIGSLLDDMGLTYYDGDRSYQVASEPWVRFFREYCGDGSFDKKIPEFVFNVNEGQKQAFLEKLMQGDGDTKDSSYRYTTSSDELRDDVMRLCIHLGRTPKYNNDSGSWRVYTGKTKNSLRVERHNSRRESREGEGVYCVSVADNHTLLAGRNGKYQFTGNSLYGFISPQGENNSGRLADWRFGESITLTGRKVIQYTAEEAVDELANRVDGDVYISHADTDGAGICWPQAPTRSTMMDEVTDILDYINGDGYDEFMRETCNIKGNHYMDVELEAYYASVFIPSEDPMGKNHDIGVKKRRGQWMTLEEAEDGFEEADEVSFKGLEAVRSDVADVTSEAQEKVLTWILKEDTSTAKERTFEYLRELHEQVSGGEYPLEEVGKRMGLQKPIEDYGTSSRKAGPHKRGAKYANEHFDGVEITQGDKPLAFHVNDIGDYPPTYTADTAEDGQLVDVIAAEETGRIPDEIEIDHDLHAEKVLVDPLEPIIRTMGWRWSDVLHEHTQSGLTDFEGATA